MFPSLCLAFALAGSVLAGLKDLADCDPLDKDSHTQDCPPDPAFATSTSFDFTKSSLNNAFKSFWEVDTGTSKDDRRLTFDHGDKGAAMEIREAGQAPTLTSLRYLFFGKVSVEVQAAKGRGVVTALVLKSDSGDEIDWELLGAYENQAATNYFYDGQALYNTYNTTYTLTSSSYSAFHKYTIEWTDKALTFSIDDSARKTWRLGDIPPEKWPQTPMQVKVGVWAVGKDTETGEIDWAGGVPDWGKAPFRAYWRNLVVEDYMGGCEETSGDVEYVYDERTRGWQEVQVRGCKKKTTPGMYTPNLSAYTALPTVTRPGGIRTISSSTSTSTSTSSGTDSQPSPSESGDADDDEGKAAGRLVEAISSTLAVMVFFGWLVVW